MVQNEENSSETNWVEISSAQTSKRQPRRTQESSPNMLSWMDELPIIPPSTTTTTTPFALSVILLVGLPGSGKSTFANTLCRCMPWKYVRINQDELKTRGACQAAMRTALIVQQKCPIIDRCNMSRAHRQAFFITTDIPAPVVVPIDCIVFEIHAETCIYRCQQRRHHPTVEPSKARNIIAWQQQDYEVPQAQSEGFRSVNIIRDDETFQRILVDILSCKNDH